jgi:hypothetical protein
MVLDCALSAYTNNIIIQIADITSIKKITKEESSGFLKVWGNSGFFGYWGIFHTKNLADFEFYAKNKSNLVLINTIKTKVILSPDDLDNFISVLEEKIKLLNY